MADTPSVDTVEEGDDYYHVRFRDPDDFDTIRTPDWAEEAASSVDEGSEVRTGKLADGDDWLIESVLIPIDDGDREYAKNTAEKIVEKIES